MRMGQQSCPSCDAQFETARGLGVHHTQVHGERLPNRTCAFCDADFHSGYEKKYCSSECLDAAKPFEGASNPNYQDKQETTKCKICESEFSYYPSEKVGIYCPECVTTEDWQSTPDVTGENNPQWNGGKEEVTCVICGEVDLRYPSNIAENASVCSESCRQEWLSEHFEGANHPNWEGGGSLEYGKGWNRVRKAALERDDVTCQVCRSSHEDLGRNPDVHHIVPVRKFINSENHHVTDAHSLDNVVSLCATCHRKAEIGTISPHMLYRKIGVDPATVERAPEGK